MLPLGALLRWKRYVRQVTWRYSPRSPTNLPASRDPDPDARAGSPPSSPRNLGKTAFQIGFIASAVPHHRYVWWASGAQASMGMMMMSPVMVALPFKIMLFVLGRF